MKTDLIPKSIPGQTQMLGETVSVAFEVANIVVTSSKIIEDIWRSIYFLLFTFLSNLSDWVNEVNRVVVRNGNTGNKLMYYKTAKKRIGREDICKIFNALSAPELFLSKFRCRVVPIWMETWSLWTFSDIWQNMVFIVRLDYMCFSVMFHNEVENPYADRTYICNLELHQN